jgi:hypothetical protein
LSLFMWYSFSATVEPDTRSNACSRCTAEHIAPYSSRHSMTCKLATASSAVLSTLTCRKTYQQQHKTALCSTPSDGSRRPYHHTHTLQIIEAQTLCSHM